MLLADSLEHGQTVDAYPFRAKLETIVGARRGKTSEIGLIRICVVDGSSAVGGRVVWPCPFAARYADEPDSFH